MNEKAFKLALQNTPWWISNLFEDLDEVVNTWELLYKNIVDEFITTRKAKIRKNSLPWVTTELRKLLNKRYKLLKIWQHTKDSLAHIRYKQARNLANIKMREAESEYWRNEFEKATNSKQFWRTVKRVQKKRTRKQKSAQSKMRTEMSKYVMEPNLKQ